MRIIALFIYLFIQQNNFFAQDSANLSAKYNYQKAFRKNEHDLLVLKESKEKLEEAKNKYKLAQYNLKRSQKELASCEVDVKKAEEKVKKSQDILKNAGDILDKSYSN